MLLAETGCEDTQVPLPNVTAKILSKVIEYCRFHVDSQKKNSEDKPAKSDDEIKSWDNEFVKVDQATLFELILVSSSSASSGYMGGVLQMYQH